MHDWEQDGRLLNRKGDGLKLNFKSNINSKLTRVEDFEGCLKTVTASGCQEGGRNSVRESWL